MGIQFQRLNADASWWVSWDGTSIVVDPWLVGSQVNGFRWFNEQTHVVPPVEPHSVPPYDAMVLTQKYTDHTHLATIEALEAHAGLKPFVAVSGSRRNVSRSNRKRAVSRLQTIKGGFSRVGSLRLARLGSAKPTPPQYNGLLILNEADEAVIYAPHGLFLRKNDEAFLRAHTVQALLTSFVEFKLPPWIGGVVTPGFDHAQKLIDKLHPAYVFATHDEDKAMHGYVGSVAKRREFDTASWFSSRSPRVVYESLPVGVTAVR